jgi:hypothetical protein
MRWAGLFDDLEAQASALERAARASEVDERTRIEAGRVPLTDRIRPAVGSAVRITTVGGWLATGMLRRVSTDWVLVEELGGREVVVMVGALISLGGVRRMSAAPDSLTVVESRLGVRHLLRGIARDRSPVRIHARDGTVIDGTMDRLGSDYVEVAAHAPGEPRRRAEVREVLLVAIPGIAMIRRDSA